MVGAFFFNLCHNLLQFSLNSPHNFSEKNNTVLTCLNQINSHVANPVWMNTVSCYISWSDSAEYWTSNFTHSLTLTLHFPWLLLAIEAMLYQIFFSLATALGDFEKQGNGWKCYIITVKYTVYSLHIIYHQYCIWYLVGVGDLDTMEQWIDGYFCAVSLVTNPTRLVVIHFRDPSWGIIDNHHCTVCHAGRLQVYCLVTASV